MDPPPPHPVDLLSSLPEHLLDEILTRLDLRDAVRTSTLSRAWHRRWETLPGLALTFPDGTPALVVYRVLLRYSGPSISRFVSDVDAPASHVNDWLIALSGLNVESISISNTCRGHFAVHSSIFSCNRLVSLSLVECSIPPLPGGGGFAGFPVLQELYLKYVMFAYNVENQLQGMIRASPMLRVLLLEEVYAYDCYCAIEAPNLKALVFVYLDGFDCPFRDLPRLQYASMNVPGFLMSGPVFVKVLAGVSQVQELILNLPRCYYKIDSIPFIFYNLKSMELSVDFGEMDKILLMFCLLRSSPNLENLKIELEEPEMVGNRKFLRAQWTDGMCANLKVVQITSYEGWLPLYFMKLILSKASALHTLSVDACPMSQDDRLNELLNCRRASPQVQILFKVQLERICFNRMKFTERDSTKEQG